MNQSREHVRILPLYRDDVSAVPHGDNRFLQEFLCGRGAHGLVQPISNALILISNFFSNSFQLRRSTVRHLILRQNAAIDVLFQFIHPLQQIADFLKGRNLRNILCQECFYLSGNLKADPHLQQFPHVQHPTFSSHLQNAAQVRKCSHRNISLIQNNGNCFRSFRLCVLNCVQVGHRFQL